ALRAALAMSALLALSSLAFALFWLPRWLWRRPLRALMRPLALRVLPLVASVCGLATAALLSHRYVTRDFVPPKNAVTIAIFVVPTLFAVTSLTALAYALVRLLLRRGPEE